MNTELSRVFLIKAVRGQIEDFLDLVYILYTEIDNIELDHSL